MINRPIHLKKVTGGDVAIMPSAIASYEGCMVAKPGSTVVDQPACEIFLVSGRHIIVAASFEEVNRILTLRADA